MFKTFRVVATVALLAILAWRMDFRQVAVAFAGLRVGWWLLAVLLLSVTQVVSAWRWQVIARPLGFERSLWQLTRFSFIGLYFNLLLPTSVGGDVMRAWYLDGHTGKRLLAFTSVVVDRASGLLMLLAMGCIAALCSPLQLETWILWFVYGAAACALVGFLTALWLAQQGGQAGAKLRQLCGVGAALRSPRVVVVSTLLSMLTQAGGVVVVWLVGMAIDARVPWTFYWVLVPTVSLLTLLPISLSGMGVREGAVVLLLAPLGVGEEMAVSLSVMWFTVYITTGLFGGIVYLVGQISRVPEQLALAETAA